MDKLQHRIIAVKAKPLNMRAAREYLAGVESLAREAREARDPRVIITALAMLGRQAKNVARLESQN